MSVVNVNILKGMFSTGATPPASAYADLIDTLMSNAANFGNITAYTSTIPGSTNIPTIISGGGLVQFAHGLGALPSVWEAVLHCITADTGNGYAVGDEIPLAHTFFSSASGSLTGAGPAFTVQVNATYGNIVIPAATYIFAYNPATPFSATPVLLTRANWAVAFRAYLLAAGSVA
jgi:hypothetical protein